MQLLRNGLMQATDSALSFGVASVYWGNAANRGGQGLFADWHVSGSRTASIARAQPAKTKEAREVVAAGTAYSADTRRGLFRVSPACSWKALSGALSRRRQDSGPQGV
mgnify:CR=1 FL=1